MWPFRRRRRTSMSADEFSHKLAFYDRIITQCGEQFPKLLKRLDDIDRRLTSLDVPALRVLDDDDRFLLNMVDNTPGMVLPLDGRA